MFRSRKGCVAVGLSVCFGKVAEKANVFAKTAERIKILSLHENKLSKKPRFGKKEKIQFMICSKILLNHTLKR